MIRREENIKNPLLKAIYKMGPDNMVRIEPGSVCRKTLIEGNKAPRLYENLKLSR